MKMSITLYKELETDCHAVMQSFREKGYAQQFTNGDMWTIFNTVMFDRMNDDLHPAFTGNHRTRLLPFWSRNGETRNMQGNDHWLNRFYDEEDLNDSHITTALNRILRSSQQ